MSTASSSSASSSSSHSTEPNAAWAGMTFTDKRLAVERIHGAEVAEKWSSCVERLNRYTSHHGVYFHRKMSCFRNRLGQSIPGVMDALSERFWPTFSFKEACVQSVAGFDPLEPTATVSATDAVAPQRVALASASVRPQVSKAIGKSCERSILGAERPNLATKLPSVSLSSTALRPSSRRKRSRGGNAAKAQGRLRPLKRVAAPADAETETETGMEQIAMDPRLDPEENRDARLLASSSPSSSSSTLSVSSSHRSSAPRPSPSLARAQTTTGKWVVLKNQRGGRRVDGMASQAIQGYPFSFKAARYELTDEERAAGSTLANVVRAVPWLEEDVFMKLHPRARFQFTLAVRRGWVAVAAQVPVLLEATPLTHAFASAVDQVWMNVRTGQLVLVELKNTQGRIFRIPTGKMKAPFQRIDNDLHHQAMVQLAAYSCEFERDRKEDEPPIQSVVVRVGSGVTDSEIIPLAASIQETWKKWRSAS